MKTNDDFLDKARNFKEVSDTLYSMVDRLAETIIINVLSDKFETEFKQGTNAIENADPIKEIRIEGSVFQLINKDKVKYKAYVLHLEREYNLPYLGFMYKKEIVSPHIVGEAEEILKKFSDEEIAEISVEIEKRINRINKDLEYLNSGIDLKAQKFYFRNYEGLVDGDEHFNDLDEVFQDYKSI